MLLCEEKYRQVTFGTFHGIFYGILRHAYGLSAACILGEEKKENSAGTDPQRTSADGGRGGSSRINFPGNRYSEK